MFRFLFFFCSFASILPANSPQMNAQPQKKAESFKAFTGKILANKVRIRAKADLDSPIVRQVNKGELLLIVADAGEFWAVQPPKGIKAYVFRSYALDNTIEANHVNVRLEPHVDAPIIGQLQAGEKIDGTVCAMNQKWLEITPPKNTHFYISKEFVGNAGGPDHLISMEKRKAQAEELLNSALFLAEAECKKSYEEISLQPAMEQFQTVIRSYTDFPENVERAKEGLALLKDAYMQKKISYLEARADLSPQEKEALVAKHREEVPITESTHNSLNRLKVESSATCNRADFWDTIEESLYLSWSAFHTERSLSDFYQEQRANATLLSGTIELYEQAVRNRPGDYILRGSHAPIGYLYSTVVDLQKHVGKKVSLMATPRPNNHFAFPAYFVLSID